MKGIIIYEDYRGKQVVEAIKLGTVNYKCTSDDNWVNELSGIRMSSTQACCNKSDTYDFETGALIALMKMCGFDKSYKAIDEAFKYNSYDVKKSKEYEEEIKALVALFKKLDQKKVDAAYKEAYNTKLPVWQKEVLNQMYDVYVDKWLYKPPTKREEMWDKIFALHKKGDVIIKVKREDVNAFLHEIENKFSEITWASGVKIFETKYTIGDIYAGLKLRDVCYFRLRKENKLSYSSDEFIYAFKSFKRIDYLPPMRWDLFKKGRIVVGCTEEEVPEFREKVVRELGNVRMEKYSVENLHCNGPIRVYFHYNKDTNWLKPLLVSGIPRVKVNNHKVVYWEDVR